MNAAVERIELAPGLSISRVLTGLWQIADMERDGQQLDLDATAACMQPYVESGLTSFDMADHYGSAEIIAGKFRQQKESQVQLLTKWVPEPGSWTRDEVRTAIEQGINRMQVDQLDLLQFHAWNYSNPNWLDCLFWLQELKLEGLIQHLGVTNFDTAHLRIAVHSGIEIVSNQVCCSLLDLRANQDMTEFCLEHGIKILAYGTLAGGFLTEKWLGKTEPAVEQLKTWSQMKYWRFIQSAGGWEIYQDLLRTVDQIAKKYRVSMANIACRYILDQPAIGGIIVGARLGQSEHIRENLRLFEFSMADEDRAQLAETVAKLKPIPGDCGDEYRRPPFLTASGDLSHHVKSRTQVYGAEASSSGRISIDSGTPWEELGGYCRAVRRGQHIWVSGTTATHRDKAIGGNDPAAQMHFVIDKITAAIESLGGQLEDVVRTRVYIQRLSDWESIARVHGERFGHILPANTMVQASLIGDEYLVEVEAEAVVE